MPAGALAAPAGGSPGTSRATVAGSIVLTMSSDAYDWVGLGQSHEFDQTNARFGGTVTASGITLRVSGRGHQDWTVQIDPPRKSSFHVGYYDQIERAAYRTGGHAGLDIIGQGHGCDRDSGAIDVRDVALSGSAITRLDLLFEQHCEDMQPALFGELRIGEPRPAGLIVSSSAITWPSVPGLGSGATGTTTPVYIRNPGTEPVNLGKPSLTGFAASDFAIVSDTCGSSLAAGTSCKLGLRFVASARGARPAVLTLPLAGQAYDVPLAALVRPGVTSLVMHSQPGDWVGQGGSYRFTPATAWGFNGGSASGLLADVVAYDGEDWSVKMFPAPGHMLTVGVYKHAQAYPASGDHNALSVAGDARGCSSSIGSFTVKQAVFSDSGAAIQHFDGLFVQHCYGDKPALTGDIKYDNEPVISPPPGVSALHAAHSTAGLHLTWRNPAVSMFSYTVVRIEASATPAGVAPVSGAGIYAGHGGGVLVTGLVRHHVYTVAAYTIDRYGNVSRPVRLVVRP